MHASTMKGVRFLLNSFIDAMSEDLNSCYVTIQISLIPALDDRNENQSFPIQ